MDQAAVLPDPLDESAASTLPSADDLLAQLAGEEIDRLLAESEAEAASLSLRRRTQDETGKPASEPQVADPSPAPVPTPSPVPLEEPPEVNLDALAKEVESSGEVKGMPAPAAEASPTTTVAAATPARSVEPPAAQAPPPAAAASLASPVPVPAVAPAPAVAPPAAVDAVTLDDVLVASTLPADPTGARDETDALPLYLKPLAWLNAPLDALPEPWTDALGKAAIITLVNAIAVLLYVALFRH